LGELASRAARSLSAASHRAREPRRRSGVFLFLSLKAKVFHDGRKGPVAATDNDKNTAKKDGTT
jgi:hypothetical protein